jgi:hypothetical protein
MIFGYPRRVEISGQVLDLSGAFSAKDERLIYPEDSIILA